MPTRTSGWSSTIMTLITVAVVMSAGRVVERLDLEPRQSERGFTHQRLGVKPFHLAGRNRFRRGFERRRDDDFGAMTGPTVHVNRASHFAHAFAHAQKSEASACAFEMGRRLEP